MPKDSMSNHISRLRPKTPVHCTSKEQLASSKFCLETILGSPFSYLKRSFLVGSLFSFAANRMSPATEPPRGPAQKKKWS